MQKCAFLPGKMQKSGVELGKLKVHVAVVRNTKIAVVKISNTKELQDFTKTQNMHNCASRYKLDTSYKTCKVLIYKGKLIF